MDDSPNCAADTGTAAKKAGRLLQWSVGCWHRTWAEVVEGFPEEWRVEEISGPEEASKHPRCPTAWGKRRVNSTYLALVAAECWAEARRPGKSEESVAGRGVQMEKRKAGDWMRFRQHKIK